MGSVLLFFIWFNRSRQGDTPGFLGSRPNPPRAICALGVLIWGESAMGLSSSPACSTMCRAYAGWLRVSASRAKSGSQGIRTPRTRQSPGTWSRALTTEPWSTVRTDRCTSCPAKPLAKCLSGGQNSRSVRAGCACPRSRIRCLPSGKPHCQTSKAS